MSKPFEKLPGHSKPINYDLTLTPNLADFTFKGEQSITVEILEPTDTLKLNSVDIVVQSAKFNDIAAEISYQESEETLELKFPSPLPACEQGTLSMSFTGQLNDRMKGFYRSKYTKDDGTEVRCGVTQFEPTDARRSLPCWDEPELKATFDVTLVVEKSLTALSNMPEVGRTDTPDGLVAVKFARSPIMSTYLLAYVVGQFDYVEDKDSDGVLLRVYTALGKQERGQFALEVAKKTLPFYREFFGIAYPLPKLDLIAIPDFAAGAMENWGLVTYRETALLVDAANSSASTKEWVALVVGHELAHQWFGNLVTMKWWTHLWLNEGFASWIEYLCVDHCYPEFDIWTRFVQSDLSRALELDALENSHPIEVAVGHPSEIDEIFDAISYSKGASVIRMLHEWLGHEPFRAGLNRYLNRHQYANATTEQLWDALSESSGQPVEFVMECWTKQMGYPAISVSSKPLAGDESSVELTLTQQKFQLGGGAKPSDLLWKVPVQLVTASGHKEQLVLAEKSATVRVPNAAWIKLNPGCIGVYRVEYSEPMLQDLIAALNHGQLSVRDRFNLENDLFAMASAGRVPTVQVMQLADAYKAEEFYTVWSDLLGNLGGIHVLADHLGLETHWRAFTKQLCEPAFLRLGWDQRPGDGHDAALLRALLLGALGRSGHPEVVAEAQARFAKHASGEATIHADLRACVYGTVLAHGGAEDFETLLGLLDKAEMQEEKVRILRSLGRARDPALRQRIFDLAVSDKVRLQDTVFVIGGACHSLEARRSAWEFVKSRWAWFVERFAGQFLLSRLVQIVCNDFCTEADASDVEEFFKVNPAPSAERNIKQALENTRLNVAILDRDGASVKEFLAQF